MDWNTVYQIGSLVVALLFGSQGVRAWSKQRSVKERKSGPRSAAADYLTGYYQKELSALRADLRNELAGVRSDLVGARNEIRSLTHLRQCDERYIDALEAQIWRQQPPPPIDRAQFYRQPNETERGTP